VPRNRQLGELQYKESKSRVFEPTVEWVGHVEDRMEHMAVTEQKTKRSKLVTGAQEAAASPIVRLEIVDNWHKDWAAVLESIRRSGQKELLLADVGGWLSARQSVLAAFKENRVVGQLIFHVQPMHAKDGGVVLEDGRVILEAHLDGMAVDPRHKDWGIDQLLLDFAESHAKTLQCRGGLRRN
jgi:GNAT superfamily N-acetyltransferase